MKYKTIYENENYIIINKPAGLLTHGANYIKEITLADQLLKKYPLLTKIGEDPIRPGIVHRLDRQVSGLLAVAKTQKMFEHMKSQFQNRKIIKIYNALVYGQIEKDEDEINFPIKRSSKGNKMAALPATTKGKLTKEGRRAITEFEIIKKFINYTLLKVRIKTGRTHQIRVHMAAYGHPIVGDDLYSTKKTREKNARLRNQKQIDPNMIYLAAIKLSFSDLDNKQRTFEIKLPNKFNNLLKIIK